MFAVEQGTWTLSPKEANCYPPNRIPFSFVNLHNKMLYLILVICSKLHCLKTGNLLSVWLHRSLFNDSAPYPAKSNVTANPHGFISAFANSATG